MKRPARKPRQARRNESAPSFQPLSIYTPQFQRWFGRSKVVDAQGRPLAVYHGTEKAGFTAFSTERGFDFDATRKAFFFSDSREVACSYAGTDAEITPGRAGTEGLYKVYLSLQNPLIGDANDASWDELDFPANSLVARVIRGVQRSAVQPDGAFYGSTNEVAFYAAQAGYDGVILHNVRDYGPFSSECGAGDQPATVYIAFKPNQIKSIHNNGTFSTTSDELLRNPHKRKTVHARRNSSEYEDEDEADGMDEICQSLDYGLMQEGEDIGRRFDRYGGRGYHDTSPERAAQIKAKGLGAHPGKTYVSGGGIEGHEVPFWMCAWAHPDVARRLIARGRKANWSYEVYDLLAHELSLHLAERYPNLKVVWFYRDEYGGGISKFAGSRCSFDLRKAVDWLASNASDGPYLFGDPDMGWCLSWDGPTIPPRFLEWVESNPRRRSRR